MTLAATRAEVASWRRVVSLFAGAFVLFVLALAVLEQVGLSRDTLGYVFLAATVLLYAAIGIANRTNEVAEYYVAGRRVPAMFNGMAMGADWMPAAAFIAIAGGLYLHGDGGLAFVVGWGGGFVLIAVLFAPYLRRFGQFTLPDFFGARYGGHIPRLLAAALTITCSFTYVVAQVYGVGLITTRLTRVPFEVGIWLGLGGVLVCAFLGGMKAVTWTQVAQYVVLLVACVLAVTWLAGRQSTAPSADAVPPEISVASAVGGADPRELEVARIVAERGAQARRYLADHGNAWRTGRDAREREVAEARGADDLERLQQAERALVDWPGSERAAVARWRREAEADARLGRRAPATARDAASAPAAASASLAAEIGAGVGAVPESNAEVRGHARLNFAALVFCLMVGTAALPHVLMRFYTTASVREARRSAAWTLLFVLLLYLAAPALATLLRQAIHADLVGTAFTSLPTWIPAWQQLDPALLDLKDVNGDGVVQRNEILMGTDTIFLAAPEAATLPYVLSALVAAGGLAAALSTTDGLLLTISNALSHDVYYKVVDPDAPAARRVMISKITLLVIAVLAALVAARRPADVLFLIAAAFSLSAAGFFPALVLGIFWKRATGLGAVAGMLAGLAITVGYMVRNQPWLREVFLGIAPNAPVDGLWWGIQPVAAGLFGVPLGFAVIVLVSLLTPAPSRQTQDLVEQLRSPGWRSPAS